jgi:AraC-like DNA-binding protein
MAVQFFFEDRFKDSVVVSPSAPAHCKPHLLPDAEIIYTSGKFGSFLSQEIFGEDYTICEYRFYITDKGLLYPVTTTPLLTLVYILKGTLNCLLQGFGPIELTEGKYYFFYVPANVYHEAYFEPGDYIFFHINLNPNYLLNLSTRSPSMKELIRRQKENVPAGLKESMGQITLKERVIIEQITQSTERNDERDMFLRGRIYDLLLLYSKDLQRMTANETVRENRYMMKIMEAKNQMDSNNGKPLKISPLSKKLNINSQVLKKEFKAAFGKSIYAYQLQLRMDKACYLLLKQEVSIDKIAEEIGYTNTSSFILKFRELFGVTPYQYHKKYNP